MPTKRPPVPRWQNLLPQCQTQPGSKSARTDQTPPTTAACAHVPFTPRREARESNRRLRREPASPDSPLGQGWEIGAHLCHRQGDSSPCFALRGWGSAGINRSGRGVNHPSRLQLKPLRLASLQAGSSATPRGHYCSGKGWEPKELG